ncbi:MAG: hydrogenase maturation protease [Rhodobacteraceae bacterium]|nr:hydrogenase maturation protease [Paracoccaceae bacterium]
MMHLIGYGNPGRCDDGLGQAFAMRIAARNLPGIEVTADYQLSVDHALLIAEAQQVVFVDALMHADAPFGFAGVQPAPSHDLSSHSLSPAAVLALAATLFDAAPQAFVLGIGGGEFGEVKEGLSPVAEDNLCRAEAFFLDWLRSPKRQADASGYAHA